VEGRFSESHTEDEDRPVGGRPYLDPSRGALPRRVPRPHDPRSVPHHENVYRFPRQPRPSNQPRPGPHDAAGSAAPGRHLRRPLVGRETGEDLETTHTMELAGSGPGSRETWRSPATDQHSRPTEAPSRAAGRRHARRDEPAGQDRVDRRRRLTLQAGYVCTLALACYLLLGGIGVVGLPFNPVSLIPGGDSRGSGHPTAPPSAGEVVPSPSTDSFTAEEPTNTRSTRDPEASTSMPTPTAALEAAAATASPTPSATPPPTAEPSTSPKNHKPTAPPGQTKKPTTPAPS
jgi:hypothetical protein